MGMISINYINRFFESLNMEADKCGQHSYKDILSGAVKRFVQNENKSTAKDVYEIFLDIYKVGSSDKKTFTDLLDALVKYEESMGVLNDKQRDHYVHSVNVFLLGIMIYAQNDRCKSTFSGYLNSEKVRMFKSQEEEFLFRWGLASLFHDIGYPVEMVSNQLSRFFNYVINDPDSIAKVKPYVGYKNFDHLDMIEITHIEGNLINGDMHKTGGESVRPSKLIADKVFGSFDIDRITVHKILENYLDNMQNEGFVDHGFYSAIIVLRWYGWGLQHADRDGEYLLDPITDAATAVFLHNAYKKTFQRTPVNLGRMKAPQSPLSYLLILCDEIQEWNRKAYGEYVRSNVQIDSISKIYIDNDKLEIHYVTTKGYLTQEFAENKKRDIKKVLCVEDIFPKGLDISATDSTKDYIEDIRLVQGSITPRVMIEQLENLARVIHEDYRRKQIERNGEADIKEWDGLDDSLKYSNVRQAMGIADKMEFIGCCLSEDGYPGVEVDRFDEDIIEILAAREHAEWVDERMKNGWQYGVKKDVKKKISPYMIPYMQLPEDIKELDRDTVRNIIPLVKRVGLKVYKKYIVDDMGSVNNDDMKPHEELDLKIEANKDYVESTINNYMKHIRRLKEGVMTDTEKKDAIDLFEKVISFEEKGDAQWDARYAYAEFLFEIGEHDKALRMASEYADHAEELEQEENLQKGRALITRIYREV